MKQDLYIQMICENSLEGYILKQNHKRVLMSDNIWKTKLESCKLKQSDEKIKCKRSIGLIGIVRGSA